PATMMHATVFRCTGGINASRRGSSCNPRHSADRHVVESLAEVCGRPPDGKLMNLDAILKEVDECGASDLYLIAGSVPCMNIDGVFVAPRAAENKRLSPLVLEDFARTMMNPDQWAEFERHREFNMAFMADGVGRFRVNMLFQRGSIGMV